MRRAPQRQRRGQAVAFTPRRHPDLGTNTRTCRSRGYLHAATLCPQSSTGTPVFVFTAPTVDKSRWLQDVFRPCLVVYKRPKPLGVQRPAIAADAARDDCSPLQSLGREGLPHRAAQADGPVGSVGLR